MKRLALATLVIAAGLTTSATAQYYDGPRGGGGYGGGGYDGPRRGDGYGGGGGYEGRRGGYDGRRGDDGFDGRRGDGYGRGGGGGGGGRGGGVCVTSRGACQPAFGLPKGSRCRCDIAGFGEKRGIVQ